MIEERAVVVDVEQDQATLEIVRAKPCGLCGQTRGCGISIWGGLLGHRAKVFRADNQINARTGDQVVIGIDERALMASSLAAYGVPLFSLLIGAALAGSFASVPSQADAYAFAGAGLGLLLGLFWLRAHAAGREAAGRFRPKILRRFDAGADRICHRG